MAETYYVQPVKPPLAKVTLTLMAINIILFVWQILTGVDANSPSTADAIRWGADYAPLTYLQEPFRLFSSMFFHFGFPHLMFNMWALYVFGNLAEHTFGRFYFLCLYLLAGIMGSLFSGYIDIYNSIEMLKHFDPDLFPRVSAGASGAVMGIGGALTALSFFPRLARQQLALDKKSLLLIMGINLAFGFFTSGINNAAHIGGMLMGAILAIAWYAIEHFKLNKLFLVILLIIAAAICYAFFLYSLSLVQNIAPFWHELMTVMLNKIGLLS
ncbi:rhomboid family intramembrane serine protease [Acinetobacter rudis]|uniref:Rhomboid family intramembrane serine protease n=1 Tax=Acinetobacter rudis TaxID=632955 RepID=A0AAW8J8L6_9GAMM|nr:rhomboid family intramembrane serine protease [Acinetobacter rudis]MDQ8936094.1 rhomboid family intramembrane serine protease [Acinetobacter rudis]MDQ8953225.1 rhomboid family intramembrane serine protease [Acinetobacter rudis]MDQ9018357.1 rhomboid family intramembrane serine protease [Acinetobacter rudis]